MKYRWKSKDSYPNLPDSKPVFCPLPYLASQNRCFLFTSLGVSALRLTHTASTDLHPINPKEEHLRDVKLAKFGRKEYIVVMTRKMKSINPKYCSKHKTINN